MKTKTFDIDYDELIEDFNKRVDDFIKDKWVIRVTTNEAISDNKFTHSLTILYKED